MKKFELEIELGNDAMKTRFDVAKALSEVARRLRTTGRNYQAIMDRNGNKVGKWTFKEE